MSNSEQLLSARQLPWRVIGACGLAFVAGLRAPFIIDGYHTRFDHVIATVIIVAALWLAWRAIRSPVRWDRLLGYPVFGVLALMVLLMALDRFGGLLTPP